MKTIKYELRRECIHCNKISVSIREISEDEWCEWEDADPDNVYVTGSVGQERYVACRSYDCGCSDDIALE